MAGSGSYASPGPGTNFGGWTVASAGDGIDIVDKNFLGGFPVSSGVHGELLQSEEDETRMGDMMKRMAKMGVLVAAGVLLLTAGPAAADNPFPGGPANKPYSFGDCVATVAATDESLEDYTVDVRYFVQDVGPPASHRPGLEEQFRCGTFYSPSIEHP